MDWCRGIYQDEVTSDLVVVVVVVDGGVAVVVVVVDDGGRVLGGRAGDSDFDWDDGFFRDIRQPNGREDFRRWRISFDSRGS